MATGDDWLGILNSPYGAMDWSAEGILKIWNTDIIEIIKEYAEVKDKYAGDIRVVGPSIAHK